MKNNKTKLFLAPMAGVADRAFRIICEEFLADGTTTEMVSAKALTFNDKKTAELLCCDGQKQPSSLQIFGHEPKIMAQGTLLAIEEFSRDGCAPAAVDLNMGCPAPKIVKSGDGSALMKTPELIYEITAAVRQALPPEIPLTVKMRSGFDTENVNAPRCAELAVAAGAAAVTVHARTRDQFYAGKADLSVIAAVKSRVSVPVFGNGDVEDGASAAKMLRETGCDGIMIGRGALGNPFVFAEIHAFLAGESYQRPSLRERLFVCKRQIELAAGFKSEHTAMLEARKHFAWYIKGVRGAAGFKNAANRMVKISQLSELIEIICEQAEVG